MQDIFGSVRRSLVFRTNSNGDDGRFGGLVEKLGTSIRKSRIGLFSKPQVQSLLPKKEDDGPQIRWRKGELIGSGAFGSVYMGMNLDSGELLAIKQVMIAANSAREATRVNIRELEEEVKLLKNLSHPNIVRYLGTAREDDSLNILLEFVPGGSISSLLGKFGSFPEPVIALYTKQLLVGLEYLHKNGIMHRDIKGANILVDNRGCIKLADFGASKKVVELATMNGAKSMKGTPYWMAPEVIRQTGHSFSADIWSVGCTVIEMATGKPPWSQQYEEFAALFHIGTTKSHPPIPEHLSADAKDFLLKCLQKEPNLRSTATDLLQHPFLSGKYQEHRSVFHTSTTDNHSIQMGKPGMELNHSIKPMTQTTCIGLKDIGSMNTVRCSTVYPEMFSGGSYMRSNNSDDDMCMIDDQDDLLGASMERTPARKLDDCSKSYNPMCEPDDGWPCKFDESPVELSETNRLFSPSNNSAVGCSGASDKDNSDFTFPCGPRGGEDDDEVTETKIRDFIDEKALEFKKLQTPLYEEFFNTTNATGSPTVHMNGAGEKGTNMSNLPPKSKSPNRVPSRRQSSAVDAYKSPSPGRYYRRASNISSISGRTLREIQPPQVDELKGLDIDAQQQSISPSVSFAERQKKWKQELVEELERKREIMRQTSVGGNQSPNNRVLHPQRDQPEFAFLGR